MGSNEEKTGEVWVNPNGRALRFLEDERRRGENAERRRREEAECQRREKQARGKAMKPKEEAATTQALAKQPKPEILPPEKPRLPVLDIPKPPAPTDIGPQLDAAVHRFENLIETALKAFDLGEPEGFLDAHIFERKDYRLAVKIARSGRAVELLENFVRMLEAAERAGEKIRALNRAEQQEYIERLRLARTALEEFHGLQHAPAAAQRQEAIEAAKARALIAQHDAEAERARRSALPPAPPPPPPPPVDPATLRKEAVRRERRDRIELDQEMKQEQADAAQEQVAQAKAKCIAIFGAVHVRAGEMRARIQKVLDAYKLDASILPSAIQDFMEEGLPEDEV